MGTKAVFLALLLAGCARQLRSARPESWLEVQSEHFVLRTDLAEADARKGIADLELIRNAILAATWHDKGSSQSRIGVVALASNREREEFLNRAIGGIAFTDRFGERMILVGEGADLLGSDTIKHEVTHALMREFLITDPIWVSEGLACFLETLEIDRVKGEAVRGASTDERREWLKGYRPFDINWSLDIMGMGTKFGLYNGYRLETFSWGLLHWLVDRDPKQFQDFLARLSRGEGMWPAFGAAFPGLTEANMRVSLAAYLTDPRKNMLTERVKVTPWEGEAQVRKIAPAEVHALRAELFRYAGDAGSRRARTRFDEELALAKAADPANPLLLALSANHPDMKAAIDAHPDDWRSWVLWFDDNDKDVAAIRKAAELAPANGHVLARLVFAELADNKPKEALVHAQTAAALSPDPAVLTALASAYELNGRCEEATLQGERAVHALPDQADERLAGILNERLVEIASNCGKEDVIGTPATRTVNVEPVLKVCRQPISVSPGSMLGRSAHFTIRSDGIVSAVSIRGTRTEGENAMLRRFVESCVFEPVLVEGRPRPVQLDLTLESLVRN
jgi:tetratricopeptide (TPR) repeat protein